MHDGFQSTCRTPLLHAGLGMLLLTLFPLVVCAQVNLFDTTPPESDSLLVHLSIGQSKAAQPSDFADGWGSGLNLRLAVLYQFHETWSAAVAFEHAGFNGGDLPSNPEIRLFTIIPSLSFSRAGSVVTPYGRLGIGYLLQGTRRVQIRDGGFNYSNGFSRFSWHSGLVVTGNVGATIRVARGVFPFAEVSYLAGRASSVTIGHLSVRTGVAVSLGIFARMLDPDSRRAGGRAP